MRIAISGTANQGKSTLVKDFLERWPNYRTTSGSYREKLVEGTHSSQTSESMQFNILNWMVDEQVKAGKDDNVIFDRCTLDNFVYSLWAVTNGRIEPNYIDKSIDLIKESFRNLDIIFLLNYDPMIPIVEDGTRDTDVEYIQQIDNLFQGIYQQFIQGSETLYSIFPKDDMPVLIPIFGTRAERLQQIADYIDVSGALIETDKNDSILGEDHLDAFQKLMTIQQNILSQENLDAFAEKLKI